MRPTLAALCLATVLLPPASLAIDPGTAHGTLATDQGTVALAHAYAVEHRNEEGAASGPELRILITDRPAGESLLAGPFLVALEREVRERGLRGVLLRLDPRRLAAAPVRGTLLEPPADPQQGLASFTLGGTAGGIDRLKVDATRVSGRVHPAPDAAAPGNLALDATFSAPRFTDVVSARLSGARALASGPVKALLAWEDALRVGDLEAASAHATPQQAARLEACRAAVGPEVFRHQLGADIPEKRVRERQIREVILRGNRASVVLQDKRGRRVTVLVQADGAWKVE